MSGWEKDAMEVVSFSASLKMPACTVPGFFLF